MIKITNLVKNFYNGKVETEVLRGINIHIPDGQFVAIIGPSGAGKSTLLYQMSLLDRPTSGKIEIDGKDMEKTSESEATVFRLKNFGFVFQDYSLAPDLTAIENIIIPSLMEGLSKTNATKKAADILKDLEIESVIDHLPSQLSGGEQQRVSIARAVIRKPKILFADEPTANLDSKRSLEVMEILQRLNKQGQTIIMVTHEMEYAKIADRIIEIKDGQVVSDNKKTH